MATIIGTELDDPNLTGTAAADTISGLGGRITFTVSPVTIRCSAGPVMTPCTVMPAPTSCSAGPATTTTTSTM